MNTELILKDEVYPIVGCALEVLNEIGHGLHEKPYENALVVEFGLRQIQVAQQPRFDVVYKTVTVGEIRARFDRLRCGCGRHQGHRSHHGP